MTDNVIPMRASVPSLRDIPGRLRLLADQIERDDDTYFPGCFVVLAQEESAPDVYGFGDDSDFAETIVQLELARMTMLRTLAGW